VNTSAAALTREDEVRSKIRKVSTFSRGARVVCAALFGFGLVGAVSMVIFSALGITSPGPNGGAGFTPQQKLWSVSILIVLYGVWLPIVKQLYYLFGSLAAGSIYTADNVRRVRRVGLLWLLWAVLCALIPVTQAALVEFAVVDAFPGKQDWFSLPEMLSSFAAAGVILLVSWIMDVGLYEKDHAAALQREAELVI
jgi:hypothetical protein